eukprot:CAMPEP_0174262186 /NCGR_PEP_ID=MMETSP0439-20130205/12823_1 /TAXON_ID=0 /ORGANISM="Stereomyxa ramosa, Strain Chinc5" /LENGTH=185 /DNA_ID=CAMNT_0015346845 /DNA_START=19 /DNA_END=576 /DNA_ORIENTATION=-
MNVLVLLFVALFAAPLLATHYTQLDFTLEYTGKLDYQSKNGTVKASSQAITTLIDAVGNIHYNVTSRAIGSVSVIHSEWDWVETYKTFKENMTVSFGTYKSMHSIYCQTVPGGYGFLINAHHDTVASGATLNVTSGDGAFEGATGAVSCVGHRDLSGDATWICSGLFYVPSDNLKRFELTEQELP